MSALQVTAVLTIHEGKLDDFKAVAAECLANVRDKDSGTHQYDWFFNEHHTECVVRERYDDSDAVLDHIAHVGPTLGALLEVADLSVEVFGEPSPELLEATAGFDQRVYHFHLGL